MGYSVKQQGIFVEVEASSGTAETLIDADAILIQNLQFNPTESLRLIERNVINSSLNPRKAIYGGSLLGFQFEVELKGSGTAGTAPQALGDLLRSCGLDETIVAVTSVTYNPLSDLSQHESCTIGLRQGDNYRIAKGCRGNVSFVFPTGGICLARFNMIGHIESETQAAAPTPAFQAGTPPAFINVAFTVAATEFPIAELVLDCQNQISMAPDPNATDGFGAIRVTSRNSQLTLDPEDQGISTKDWVGLLRAGTSQAVATGTVGSSAGNRFALSVPLAYERDVQFGDREELMITNITMGCEDTDGTNDFSLVFT
jgi:hypothetical protein